MVSILFHELAMLAMLGLSAVTQSMSGLIGLLSGKISFSEEIFAVN